MDNFEDQFKTDENTDPSAGIRRTLMALMTAWPDVLATWKGMVNQAIEDGWEPLAARALVLSTVTGDNLAIYANLANTAFEEESDED